MRVRADLAVQIVQLLGERLVGGDDLPHVHKRAHGRPTNQLSALIVDAAPLTADGEHLESGYLGATE